MFIERQESIYWVESEIYNGLSKACSPETQRFSGVLGFGWVSCVEGKIYNGSSMLYSPETQFFTVMLGFGWVGCVEGEIHNG
jgi:hypothetical protein